MSRADLARRFGPAAQHRLGDRRSADRRGLGHRRRRRPVAARTPAAQPAPERRARRHPRRRAAARDDDRRAGRRRRALHGTGEVCRRPPRRNASSKTGAEGHQRPAERPIRTCGCEGMGVSLPGRVDDSGRLGVCAEPGLGTGAGFTKMIEVAVGLPVSVENAANACALAELWFGRHPEHVRDIVAVTVSEGIGVGLLLNGQLVHGAGVDGRRVRPRQHRRARAAVPLRTPRVLGALRVELGGRAGTTRSSSGTAIAQRRRSSMRFEDLARLRRRAATRAAVRLARADGPLPRHRAWPTWPRASRPTSSSSSARSRRSGIASGRSSPS